MMGGMMGAGWIGALLLLALLIALVVWGVNLLAKNSGGKAAKVGLVVLAAVGGIALIAVLAMSFMHFGMMGGMMSCC